jgi:hypothetical protein
MRRLERLIRLLFWRLSLDPQKLRTVSYGGMRLWHRPFDRLPLRGVGAEIGVYRGMHAKDLLWLHSGIDELWLVDPYAEFAGGLPYLPEARVAAHRTFKNSGQIRWLEVGSPACANHLPDLDFCYIDGSHEYEAVRRDIAALWPKIRPGGVLGGHDFFEGFPGVIRAVTEFAVSNHLQLMVKDPDWWIYRT